MLLDLLARLPWWAGILLAIASYLLLHSLAAQTVTIHSQPGQLGASAVSLMLNGVATGLQYALPLIFLVGAGHSAWRRMQGRQGGFKVEARHRG